MEKSLNKTISKAMYESMRDKFSKLTISEALSMRPHVVPNSILSKLMSGEEWSEEKPRSSKGDAHTLAELLKAMGDLDRLQACAPPGMKGQMESLEKLQLYMVKQLGESAESKQETDKKFFEDSVAAPLSAKQSISILEFVRQANFTAQEFFCLLGDVVSNSDLQKTMLQM